MATTGDRKHFYVLKFNVLTLFIYLLTCSRCFATLTISENLLNVTTCDTTNVVIDCGSDVIAIDTVELAYHTGTCTGDYDVTDCIQDATAGDRQTTLRECSGRTYCAFDLSGFRDFCTSGNNPASYVHVKYYCIGNSRIQSVCSSGTTMTSATGEPLYLRSPNYPSSTTAVNDCTCSFEIESCSSDAYLYILDQDLYDSPADCSQSITFADENNAELTKLECESFYDSSASELTLNNNYMTISYVTGSAFASYFFIGLAATDPSATVKITCQEVAETWCIDCGSLPSLSDGNLTLTGDSSFGSTANVQCDEGYDTDTPSISCMEQGAWESAQCIIKDCSAPPTLTNGALTLTGGTTFGSTATVQCDQGYDNDTTTITCTSQGIWSSALCTIKDCESVPDINNGTIELVNSGVTTYEAVANVTCDAGYTASTDTISCLASGIWKTATCKDDDKDYDDDKGDNSKGDKKGTLAAGIIVLMVFIVIIIIMIIAQLILVYVFHKKFCNREKRPLLIGLGFIPIVGAIYLFVNYRDLHKSNQVDAEPTNRSTNNTDVENNASEEQQNSSTRSQNESTPPQNGHTELYNGPTESQNESTPPQNGHTELYNGPTESQNGPTQQRNGHTTRNLPPVQGDVKNMTDSLNQKPLPPISPKTKAN